MLRSIAMPLRLILIRHGETDWNKEEVFRGLSDIRLNETGIAQAEATAESLKADLLEAIYSSPLKRALVTARRIALPHDMEVRLIDDLRDINYGAWQGLTEAQVGEKWPKDYERWMKSPGRMRFVGGKSTKKCWKRVISALRELLWLHGTGTIIIVSHRIPIKMMTAYLLGKNRHHINEITHDPCAISVFEIKDRQDFRPVKLNDTSHLASLHLADQKDF